ncbi:prepilin-type N-terminal cleavage/methylation domain-containing protein [bacterium]|nr:prepilin-type N-terminal cleavage/methylation domain-containing protein [bacterium]
MKGIIKKISQGIKNWMSICRGSRRFAGNQSGFTLIELIITVIILGFIAYSFTNMGSHLLSTSTDNESLYRAVQISRNRMEEAVGIGTGVSSKGWTASSSLEWNREVTVLKSSDGQPSLVAIRVSVRKNGVVLCTLVTHMAD